MSGEHFKNHIKVLNGHRRLTTVYKDLTGIPIRIDLSVPLKEGRGFWMVDGIWPVFVLF